MPAEKKQTGGLIIVHRWLAQSSWPKAEHGPAAIIESRATGVDSARWAMEKISEGSPGAIYGSSYGRVVGQPRNVLMLSDRAFHIPDQRLVRCRQWSAAVLQETSADVIALWNPRAIFPRLTLREIAEKILQEAFGGGGIYSARAFRDRVSRR